MYIVYVHTKTCPSSRQPGSSGLGLGDSYMEGPGELTASGWSVSWCSPPWTSGVSFILDPSEILSGDPSGVALCIVAEFQV